MNQEKKEVEIKTVNVKSGDKSNYFHFKRKYKDLTPEERLEILARSFRSFVDEPLIAKAIETTAVAFVKKVMIDSSDQINTAISAIVESKVKDMWDEFSLKE